MSMQNMINQFIGSSNAESSVTQSSQGIGNRFGQLVSNIPGGLAGGAAAGGIMALLLSNKSARKFAGTAATYGGTALLAGLAYKAFKNWQQSNREKSTFDANSFASSDIMSADFQLTLIKAMIAAAKANGHIDSSEQQHIFAAIDQMELTTEMKALVFDLLRKPITIDELVSGTKTLEQKSEVYLVTCMILNPDHTAEQVHLDRLGQALQLPTDLAQQLQIQAQQTMATA